MLFPSIGNLNGQIQSNETDGSFDFSRPASARFLTISPDARSAGMGELGVASEPDLQSQHWNPCKYALIDGKGGVSASYIPWLRNLLPNINLGYISGYYRINDKDVLGSSFRFFSLGSIYFTNITRIMNTHYLFELAGDFTYSRKFTDHLSCGLTIRYIHSDIAPPQPTSNGSETKAGRSVAGDLSIYYQNHFGIGAKDAIWAVGCDVSNIGTPISYQTNSENKTPIPTNLRIGSRVQFILNELNSISLHADVNKLMVPTLPVYAEDTLTGNLIVVRGKEVPESVLAGMIQSFYDAPGIMKSDGKYSVFQEELQEVAFSIGAEYWFDKALAIRSGYHHEHQTKGNRRFFTIGMGGTYRFLAADISYLIALNGQNSPLHNTFRFTLTAVFGKAYTDPSLP
jgi:hypothetical protein